MTSIGPYRIERELGAGAMGRVYLGWHSLLEHHHAIKVYSNRLPPQLLKRFKRELEMAAAVQHPGVVAIHSTGSTDDGCPWYAMDFVEGEDLESRLRRGPFEPEEALTLVIALAEALAAIHANQIVHRDLKPANILITRSGRALITDFGLGKALDAEDRLTKTGELIGTPLYMAPEQALGKTITPRTDLFALGLIFFEMLMGRAAMSADSTAGVLQKVRYGKLEGLERLRPELPASLHSLFRAATERDSERRIPDADAFRALATGCLEDLRAPPAPARSRVGRTLLIASAVALLLVGLTFGGLEWQRRSEQRARTIARLRQLHQELSSLAPSPESPAINELRSLYQALLPSIPELERARARVLEGRIALRAARESLLAGDQRSARRSFKVAGETINREDHALQAVAAGLSLRDPSLAPPQPVLALRRAIQREPKDPALHLWLARLELQADHPRSAAIAAAEARRLGSPAPDIEVRILIAEESWREALQLAGEAGVTLPRADEVRALGEALDAAISTGDLTGARPRAARLAELDALAGARDRVALGLLPGVEGPLQEINGSFMKSTNTLSAIPGRLRDLAPAIALIRALKPTRSLTADVDRRLDFTLHMALRVAEAAPNDAADIAEAVCQLAPESDVGAATSALVNTFRVPPAPPDRWQKICEPARRLARSSHAITLLAVAEAKRQLLENRPEAALERLKPQLESRDMSELSDFDQSLVFVTAAEACRKLGRDAEELAWLKRSNLTSLNHTHYFRLVVLLLATGDRDEARRRVRNNETRRLAHRSGIGREADFELELRMIEISCRGERAVTRSLLEQLQVPADASPHSLVRLAITRLQSGSTATALKELGTAASALEADHPKTARALRRTTKALAEAEGSRATTALLDKLRQIQRYLRNQPSRR